MNRGPVSEIDLSALQHNLATVRRLANNRPVIAVVKADAYGHGAVAVSKRLIDEGVSHLAVAYTEEAKVLRDSGIKAKILVLFDRTDISDYFMHDLIPVIHDVKIAEIFSREAMSRGIRIPVHVKIDTGMGRAGLNPSNAVSDILTIAALDGLVVTGLMSHFSEADLSDRSYAFQQIKLFNRIRASVTDKLHRPLMSHMANSAAILSLDDAFFDGVRPGLILYGCSPFGDERYGLMPVMKVKTKILLIRTFPAGTPVSYGRTFITKRDSRIAIVPVGYADGYSRMFSNNAEMLVRGKRVPVAGRVCMDVTMADVTDVDGIAEGDEVVIVGRQGAETIFAEELSSRINTIPYDIMTSLGSRSRREYIQ
ncbi:MAG: alanine racemase [Nitrospirae bacterium]|nr:alanine racemase [Nitrospirota bacterium]